MTFCTFSFACKCETITNVFCFLPHMLCDSVHCKLAYLSHSPQPTDCTSPFFIPVHTNLINSMCVVYFVYSNYYNYLTIHIHMVRTYIWLAIGACACMHKSYHV